MSIFRRKPNAAPGAEEHLTRGQIVWREFKSNRPAYWSMWVVMGIVLIALLSDFLAYNKPFYAVYNGETYFPLFSDYLAALGLYNWEPELQNVRWSDLDLESSIWPIVRYLPDDVDLLNDQFVSPFAKQDVKEGFKHLLGTDKSGRDVLSGLIHGTRISLSVGVISVGISAVIGILLGALAGYYGDNRFQLTRAQLILAVVGLFFGYFYGFHVRGYALADSFSAGFLSLTFQFTLSVLIMMGIIVLFMYAGKLLNGVKWLGTKVPVGVDILISRLVEVMVSIPTLLLIISVAAIAKPSLMLVMVIIGLTSWPRIARLTRGEMLRIRSLEYVQAAQALGMPEWRVILRHALPNALAPVFVSIAFGVASAILVESSLSFLGIGVPITTVTWGSLLNAARSSTSAWWLAVFPGFAIFVTVTVFNLLGEGLRDALDPRLKK